MSSHSPDPPAQLTRKQRARYCCTVSVSSNTGLRHLRVQRYDNGRHFPWWHLQLLKDEMLGPEVHAVEVFPPSTNVVDLYNFRHLWEVVPGEEVPARWL